LDNDLKKLSCFDFVVVFVCMCMCVCERESERERERERVWDDKGVDSVVVIKIVGKRETTSLV